MIHISRIKMRGFKSFKLADIIFPADMVCLAGPNGSGKSNVCDAIRFVFGETSLKALRAKRVKELISHNAKMAEVALYLDGDEKHEIRRAIRDDGKIMYKLDGERTTRTSIMDLLKKFNIDESGRNVIAQGEVTRIVNMSAKERREIIDSVAGISEFEDKKREALKDVEVVDTRIREANLILGEKIGMLNELEKEKEVATKYIEQKKIFTNARASIVKKEVEKFTADLEKAVLDSKKLSDSLKAKQAELAEIDAKVKSYDQEKGAFINEIQARQQQNTLTKKLEALKLSIGKDEQELEEKRGLISKLESEIAALKEEMKKDDEELKNTESEFKKVEDEYSSLKSHQGTVKLMGESRLRKLVENEKSDLASLREELIRTEGELKTCEQLIVEKESALDVGQADNREQEEKLASEIEILKKEIDSGKSEIEALFQREKEANAKIADIDRKFLSVREKIAALRAQNPRIASNAMMEFINQVKVKEKGAGVHGALIDLIKFDSKYANAIEAAAGQRLLYIVVDDANIATKLIAKIKESGVGRATFIPLREVKSAPAVATGEGLGPLVDYIKCDERFEKAVQYAFSETILVSDMEQAKKIGVGKYRMVTLEGEIFEKSGVITGGKTTAGIAAAGALSKLESEVADLKAARESLFSEISGIREQMSLLRSMKADKEVKVKSLEVELGALRSEDEKSRREQAEAEQKRQEIQALRAKAKALISKKAELEKSIASLSEKIAKDEKSLSEEEQQLAKQNEELNKKHTELVAKLTGLETRCEALFNEIKIRKTNLHKLESALKQKSEEKSALVSKISELERRLSSQKDELAKKEKELASSSSELEALFRKMREIEEKIRKLGEQRGAILHEEQKLNKELNSINVKRATAETRLSDLKAEFDSFREFEFLDRPKEELMEMAKAADAFLSANQTVNLASIELYDKKKAEIGDVKDRMEKLKEERDAIMKMVEEIDARKKETFFSTFYSVNDNFRKMFKYIPHVGEGFLYLDKPNEPFESGLFLKIKRGTKEMGLEALSGGENSLIALMFIFALQFVKPSPYYVLDEVDSALDKENSKNLAKLIKEMSKGSQFILVTHNDMVMTFASAVFGVSKSEGVSKIVGVKLGEKIGGAGGAPESPQPPQAPAVVA